MRYIAAGLIWLVAIPFVLWYLLTPREHPEVKKKRKALEAVNRI